MKWNIAALISTALLGLGSARGAEPPLIVAISVDQFGGGLFDEMRPKLTLRDPETGQASDGLRDNRVSLALVEASQRKGLYLNAQY